MKYTNKNNLDKMIETVLTYDTYDYNPEILSATQILSPACMFAQRQLYADKLERDIADNTASVFGSAVHSLIEDVKFDFECLKEQRLTTEIEVDGIKRTISGKFDILKKVDNKWQLIDTKTTSVWTKIYQSKDEDYIKQLSIYRYILFKNGYDVIDTAQIWWWFTDWSSSQARGKPEYPQCRTELHDIQLMSIEETEKYIKDKLHILYNSVSMVKNNKLNDIVVTNEELWKSEDVYAVMKEGRKTAVKLYENIDEANLHLQEDKGLYLEVRKGTIKRCEYCDCRNFCPKYKEYIEQGLIKESD